MKILALTQARFGSSRFPGKILRKIDDHTLLEIHLTRLLQSKKVTQVMVATTIEEEANAIVKISKTLGIKSYQGSLDDVLARFYHAASSETPDFVVRLTSDCPLIDPVVIDQIVDKCIEGDWDYASNTMVPTFPDGIDVEVFKFSVLTDAFKNATLLSDREHVTPYIWRNSTAMGGDMFRSFNFSNDKDYSKLRMTVDIPEDLELIERLTKQLGFDKSWIEYVRLLQENPDIMQINSKEERNQGYYKSLKNDK